MLFCYQGLLHHFYESLGLGSMCVLHRILFPVIVSKSLYAYLSSLIYAVFTPVYILTVFVVAFSLFPPSIKRLFVRSLAAFSRSGYFRK